MWQQKAVRNAFSTLYIVFLLNEPRKQVFTLLTCDIIYEINAEGKISMSLIRAFGNTEFN